MSRLQWNALAIFAILGILPFATAIITNAGSSTDGLYNNSIGSQDYSNTIRGKWLNNGEDYTTYYETNVPMPAGWYNCAYIEDGFCGDDYSYSTDTIKPLFSTYNSFNGFTSNYGFGQSMNNIVTNSEYLGGSGSGPYGWYIFGDSFSGIEQNDTLDKIKYTFYASQIVYNCNYEGFKDLEIYSTLSFVYGNKTKTFNDFVFETDNKYEYNRYDNMAGEWAYSCVSGFELEYDFTGFESLDLTSFNGGDWANTDHVIEIDSVVRKDNQNLANTPLPWNGAGSFTFIAEHQSINTVQAGFIIKSLTSLLSVGTFALAAASTQYWDPFKNLFKGAV